MGLALPYSSSTPADDPGKKQECDRAGQAMLKLLELDLKPRDIVTRQSFINAMRLTIVLGGSTNAVLHSLAMARSFDLDITIDDPKAYTRPWTVRVNQRLLADTDLIEFVCNENELFQPWLKRQQP